MPIPVVKYKPQPKDIDITQDLIKNTEPQQPKKKPIKK